MENLQIKNILSALKKSKFRSSFKLKQKDFDYIKLKGMPTIKTHAYDFVLKRLAPQNIPNDGKQTPTHGHPVFVAQHATATCCRNCLKKWHKIETNKQLTNVEIEYVVNVIMAWIEEQEELKK